MDPHDRLALVERLREIVLHVVDRSASTPKMREEYKRKRREALVEVRRDHLPDVLQKCRDLLEVDQFVNYSRSASEARKLVTDAFESLLIALEEDLQSPRCFPNDSHVTDVLSRLDVREVTSLWTKALARWADDPDGAITAARSLVESTCKAILSDLDISFNDRAMLPALYDLTATALDLAPAQQDEEALRSVMGGCTTVVHRLASLRNRLSDAHGGSPGRLRPCPRHASLAVTLAGAMAAFLVETWEVGERETESA
jgi:hypothetical protein